MLRINSLVWIYKIFTDEYIKCYVRNIEYWGTLLYNI